MLRGSLALPLAVAALFSTAEIVSTEAQRRTQSGDAKLAAGNAGGAVDDYRAAIVADAGAFEARVNLGAALLKLGDAQGAADALEGARALRPDHPSLLRNLGRAYLKLERWEDAAKALSAARGEDPGNEEGVRLAGIALHRAGRHADALPLLREAAKRHGKDAELLVELATAEIEAGDADAAAATISSARKAAGGKGEDASRTRNNLGLLLRRLGKNEEALAEFRAAAKADPRYTPAIANLGMALLEAGDAKAAVGTLKTAAARDPDPEIRYQLGHAKLATGDAKGAIADLEYARSWGYDPARIAAMLAEAYEKTGDAKRARSERAKAGRGVWAEAVQDAQAAKAFEALNAGRYADAVPLLGELVETDRADGKAWLGLGYARFRVGDAGGAVSALETAAGVLPDDVDVWYYLGAARHAAGDAAGAVEAWRRVLEKAPSRADVAANAGRLLLQLERPGEAAPLLQRAAKAMPKNLDLRHDWAVALVRSGDAAGAAKVLGPYVAARRDDIPAAEVYADALRKSGEHARAASAFEALAKRQARVARHAVNAALAWRDAGNRKKEKAWIERAAALAPGDADVVYHLGTLRFEDGEWDAAIDAFARVAKLDPKHPHAATNVETARKNKALEEMKASRLHLGVIVVKDAAAAKQVSAELARGKAFADVARTRSTHESAPKGGDLGWVDPATLPEWAAVAKTLPKGKRTQAIEVPGGFAIFMRYDD